MSKASTFFSSIAKSISSAPPPPPETIQVMGAMREDPLAAYQSLWPDHSVTIVPVGGSGDGCMAVVADSEGTPAHDRDAFAAAVARVLQKRYPELKFGSGSIIPIDYSQDGITTLLSGEEVYQLAQYDLVGSMALITNYSNGGPAVNVVFERAARVAKMIGAQFDIRFLPQKLINVSKSLFDFKMEALQRAFVSYLDAGAIFGDPRAGLDGLLTITGKTEYVSPAPINIGMNADLMLEILNGMAAAVMTATNTVESSKIFVTPWRVMNAAMSTRRTNSSQTVYEEFMATQRMAGLIERWEHSETVRRVDAGADVAFMLPNDPEKLCIKIPTALTYLEASRVGLGFTVHAFATTLLVVTPSPACILLIRGI
jgi:hypothetical protein